MQIKSYLSAFLVSTLLAIGFGFIIIPLLKKLKFGQSILNYVSEHNYKSGTPTMGGIIFVLSSIISFFVFSTQNKYLAIVCLVVGLSYMAVGFIDDFIKIKNKKNDGLSAIQKTLFELVIAVIISIFGVYRGLTKIYIPFTDTIIDLGYFFIPTCIFLFLATTNSVNLTDGLDGLAGGVSYLFFLSIGSLILIQTTKFNDSYVYSSEYTNVALLSFCLAGSIVGFLLFNTHKATVFMGDTGSLSLGGFIAIISIITGNLLFIPIIGITYVLSSISVILQVIYFKRTKKRIFLMAPLHHHFQHKGFDESKIGIGYKMVTLFFGLISIIFSL